MIVSGTLVFSIFSTFETFAAESNHSVWEKFLKYDLCINDYDSLSEDEQRLCHFIFDTEQAANDNIICERARRTLAGDKNIVDRITIDQLDSAYGIWDKYSAERVYGWQSYIHCVPDVVRFGSESDPVQWIKEYWLDDIGSTYVIFNEKTSSDDRSSFDVFDKNGVLLQTVPAAISETEYKGFDFRDDKEYMEKSGFINKNDGYYYIKSDETAVFAWCKFAEPTSVKPITEKSDTDPVKEPFIVEREINGCSVTAIEHGAFTNAPLTEIILPDTIEYIDYSAFYNCSYLEKINLPENLKYLGSSAFMNCISLKNIDINCPEIRLEENTFARKFQIFGN